MIIKKLMQVVPVLIIVTLTFGTIYVVAQQMLRLGANDQPLQIAQDVVNNMDITDSAQLETSKYPQNVDPAQSYTPYIQIYNKSNKLIGATSSSDTFEVPDGPLNYTKDHGQDRVTTIPKANTRVALVVLPYKNGTIAVGRSLKEVESRIDAIGKLILIGYVLSVATVIGTTLIKKISR